MAHLSPTTILSITLSQAPPNSVQTSLSAWFPAASRKKVLGSNMVMEAMGGGEGRPAPATRGKEP